MTKTPQKTTGERAPLKTLWMKFARMSRLVNTRRLHRWLQLIAGVQCWVVHFDLLTDSLNRPALADPRQRTRWERQQQPVRVKIEWALRSRCRFHSRQRQHVGMFGVALLLRAWCR